MNSGCSGGPCRNTVLETLETGLVPGLRPLVPYLQIGAA
jgi:hypothetical protein